VGAAGCSTFKKPAKASADPKKKTENIADYFPVKPPPRQQAGDPQADPRLVVQLIAYKLTVPARAVSHSEEFWKHVNEEAIDIGQHDTLFANGFRVGIAPRSDWEYFRNILERENVVTQISGSSGLGGHALELPLKFAVPEDTVMYIDPQHGLSGQIYERCDELINIHFEPVPRKPGDVRLEVTPLFRSVRSEIKYTLGGPLTYVFTHHDYLFNLKAQVDVPLDNFLILAPSSDADRTSSLGHKLLRSVGEGKEYETVLLLAPQPFQFENPPEPATQPSQTAQVIGK
jgi:hypothetical protein